jgi:hypothetical protein
VKGIYRANYLVSGFEIESEECGIEGHGSGACENCISASMQFAETILKLPVDSGATGNGKRLVRVYIFPDYA